MKGKFRWISGGVLCFRHKITNLKTAEGGFNHHESCPQSREEMAEADPRDPDG